MAAVQAPVVILPTVAPVGTETEAVANALTHVSLEFPVAHLVDKIIYIRATEVVAAVAPGVLNVWVELSPHLTATLAGYWAAIGGGGGALAPLAPVVEVAGGVNGRVHTIIIPWTAYSRFARLVVQTPVIVAGESWTIQALFSGRGT